MTTIQLGWPISSVAVMHITCKRPCLVCNTYHPAYLRHSNPLGCRASPELSIAACRVGAYFASHADHENSEGEGGHLMVGGSMLPGSRPFSAVIAATVSAIPAAAMPAMDTMSPVLTLSSSILIVPERFMIRVSLPSSASTPATRGTGYGRETGYRRDTAR